MKKWIIGIIIVSLLAVGALFAIPLIVIMSIIPATTGQNLTDGVCVNYEVGSNVPVNGLSDEQSANAVLLVQEAMKRGLGKDAAEVAVLAAMTESMLHTNSGGDNHFASIPEADWSWGLFQTKLWDHFRVAWKKPGGGYYPKNDAASIARAKALALNPQEQANWFFRKLEGDAAVGTTSLANFKWRTSPKYRGKPWMLAQKIEQSRFTNGSNYRKVWNGSKGITPKQVVETILNSDVGETETTVSGTTFTTLDTAFPDLPVNADGTYEIPGPPNARLSEAGYPALKPGKKWLSEISIPSGGTADVAKWAQGAFEDLITRWESSDALTTDYSLSKQGAKIVGWRQYYGPVIPNNFNTGTAVRLLPGVLTPPKAPSANIGGGPVLKVGGVSETQRLAIEKIVRDMGGVIQWAGTTDPGYFYITPNLRPENLEGWATSTTKLGQPPYFVVGDSIGRNMSTLLARNLPQSTVDAVDSRKTAAGITALRTRSEAKVAKTWIVELGTNDGNNPEVFRGYIDKVMSMAGPNRKVFWVNAYRPGSNSMGDALENNQALTEASRQYPNLKVLDWHSKAITNLQWFEADGMKLHPNTDGKQAMLDLILAAVTGNGNGDLAGVSFLCGAGTGEVSDYDYVVTGTLPTGKFTTNTSFQVKGSKAIYNRAMSYVGNPPTTCPNANCAHSCLHLASRAWGRNSSGLDDARVSLNLARKSGALVAVIDPATGKKNPEAFNIPVGALVYWDPDPNGHIATYVGDGKVVSNGNWGQGDGVYLVAMEAMDGYGRGYEGWTANPTWGY